MIYDPEVPLGFATFTLLVVIKDSPQPHCPLEFELMNINSDLLGDQICISEQ